jgi:hypothetical protein
MSTHALTFLGEPVSGRNRAKTHRAMAPALNERCGLLNSCALLHMRFFVYDNLVSR